MFSSTSRLKSITQDADQKNAMASFLNYHRLCQTTPSLCERELREGSAESRLPQHAASLITQFYELTADHQLKVINSTQNPWEVLLHTAKQPWQLQLFLHTIIAETRPTDENNASLVSAVNVAIREYAHYQKEDGPLNFIQYCICLLMPEDIGLDVQALIKDILSIFPAPVIEHQISQIKTPTDIPFSHHFALPRLAAPARFIQQATNTATTIRLWRTTQLTTHLINAHNNAQRPEPSALSRLLTCPNNSQDQCQCYFHALVDQAIQHKLVERLTCLALLLPYVSDVKTIIQGDMGAHTLLQDILLSATIVTSVDLMAESDLVRTAISTAHIALKQILVLTGYDYQKVLSALHIPSESLKILQNSFEVDHELMTPGLRAIDAFIADQRALAEQAVEKVDHDEKISVCPVILRTSIEHGFLPTLGLPMQKHPAYICRQLSMAQTANDIDADILDQALSNIFAASDSGSAISLQQHAQHHNIMYHVLRLNLHATLLDLMTKYELNILADMSTPCPQSDMILELPILMVAYIFNNDCAQRIETIVSTALEHSPTKTSVPAGLINLFTGGISTNRDIQDARLDSANKQQQKTLFLAYQAQLHKAINNFIGEKTLTRLPDKNAKRLDSSLTQDHMSHLVRCYFMVEQMIIVFADEDNPRWQAIHDKFVKLKAPLDNAIVLLAKKYFNSKPQKKSLAKLINSYAELELCDKPRIMREFIDPFPADQKPVPTTPGKKKKKKKKKTQPKAAQPQAAGSIATAEPGGTPSIQPQPQAAPAIPASAEEVASPVPASPEPITPVVRTGSPIIAGERSPSVESQSASSTDSSQPGAEETRPDSGSAESTATTAAYIPSQLSPAAASFVPARARPPIVAPTPDEYDRTLNQYINAFRKLRAQATPYEPDVNTSHFINFMDAFLQVVSDHKAPAHSTGDTTEDTKQSALAHINTGHFSQEFNLLRERLMFYLVSTNAVELTQCSAERNAQRLELINTLTNWGLLPTPKNTFNTRTLKTKTTTEFSWSELTAYLDRQYGKEFTIYIKGSLLAQFYHDHLQTHAHDVDVLLVPRTAQRDISSVFPAGSARGVYNLNGIGVHQYSFPINITDKPSPLHGLMLDVTVTTDENPNLVKYVQHLGLNISCLLMSINGGEDAPDYLRTVMPLGAYLSLTGNNIASCGMSCSPTLEIVPSTSYPSQSMAAVDGAQSSHPMLTLNSAYNPYAGNQKSKNANLAFILKMLTKFSPTLIGRVAYNPLPKKDSLVIDTGEGIYLHRELYELLQTLFGQPYYSIQQRAVLAISMKKHFAVRPVEYHLMLCSLGISYPMHEALFQSILPQFSLCDETAHPYIPMCYYYLLYLQDTAIDKKSRYGETLCRLGVREDHIENFTRFKTGDVTPPTSGSLSQALASVSSYPASITSLLCEINRVVRSIIQQAQAAAAYHAHHNDHLPTFFERSEPPPAAAPTITAAPASPVYKPPSPGKR